MKYSFSYTNPSIFRDGKLKPGVYKIRNIVSQTYVDTKDDVRELCGRPSTALEEGKGQWEIRPLGPGYTIRKVEPAASKKPDQFCIMLGGITNECAISVSEFPVAWKIKVVKDAQYRGCEYVRIFWGSTNMVWDLAKWGSVYDGTKVQVMDNTKFQACRIWELIPVEVDVFSTQPSSSTLPPEGSSSFPAHEGNTGSGSCTCTHRTTEPGDDGFGTTVVEVTTVTTRKKYRVEGQ